MRRNSGGEEYPVKFKTYLWRHLLPESGGGISLD